MRTDEKEKYTIYLLNILINLGAMFAFLDPNLPFFKMGADPDPNTWPNPVNKAKYLYLYLNSAHGKWVNEHTATFSLACSNLILTNEK